MMRKPVAAIAAVILLVAPLCLRGSGNRSLLVATSASQRIQNARANAYDLSRMRSQAMIRRFHRAGYLVRVPSHTRFYYLHGVSSVYRYLRPWTKLFLDRLSRQYYARFHQRLRVTSLVRTVPLQRRLTNRNPNAVDATGPDRSSHLTGATLDISKRFMRPRGKRWVRNVLYRLKESGYLYAIEEFHQPAFHVMVYPNYRKYVGRITHRHEDTSEAEETD
jgi:hypothetical protein